MTQRRDSMPCLNGTSAHWDAEAGKVRYYASFDGSDEWIEVPGEDFARLTHLHAQEAIDVICDAITSTLDRVNTAMEEFMVFRKVLEAMMPRPASAPEDKEN
jgi:hypothetical protein